VKTFVKGVTAAASGAIAGACFVLARRAIFDLPTLLMLPALLMGLVTLAILTRFKIPEPVVIIAAGLLGIAIFALRG
jgi:chromate transporter